MRVKAREPEPGEVPVMVLDNDGQELVVLCSWFAFCDNPATVLVPHPVLDDVPTCQRCADRVKAEET